MPDWLVIEGVRPYDGRYELDLDRQEFTTREWGWIKRHSDYLPLTAADGFTNNDPELMCVLAAILLRRAGQIQTADVPAVFDRLADAPYTATLKWETDGELVEVEPEADPTGSSTANTGISGTGSPTSSGTLAAPPKASGTPGSAISGSDPVTSAS